ncbi:hypothetical protein PIB30_023612 [Stylosanthes scabra]|uniref:DUF4283 domain-containing protein n=1 Tax=Stylosanthes scabra TaxID=79078 RepID=A0ABU6Z824_9FABA|nr:hypothetical protein [Stylosanthes scabra]
MRLRQTWVPKKEAEIRRKIESVTVIIFADNLPLNTIVGWLWRVFGKEGKSRREAMSAIRRLDGWRVWGCEIKLKEARKRNEERDERKGDDGFGRTFKDVLLNRNRENDVHILRDDNVLQSFGRSTMELEVDEALSDTLNRSLEGDLLNPMIYQLKTAVLKDWHTMVDLKMMGSRKAVMIFDTAENMMEAEQSPYLLNHFIEVRRWTLKEANRSRRMWLENAWTEQNMEKIGNVWGSVLRVDRGKGGHLNAFRVLVETNFTPVVQACLTVVVQGEEIQVMVKEIGMLNTFWEEQEGNEWTESVTNYNGVDGGNEGKGDVNHENKEDSLQNDSKCESSEAGSAERIESRCSGDRREEEEEPLRVRETQTVHETAQTHTKSGRNEDGRGGGPEEEFHISPTKTRSLEDDRRTEEVAKELGLCKVTKPNNNTEKVNESENDMMGRVHRNGTQELLIHSDSDLRFPPGFENWRREDTELEHRTVRRINLGKREGRKKEKERRKESKKRAENNRKAERRRKKPIDLEAGGSDSVETISDSDGEGDAEARQASRTWKLGRDWGFHQVRRRRPKNL